MYRKIMEKGIIKVTTSFNILNLPESNSCESVKHLVADGLRLHKKRISDSWLYLKS
jgi:hypothetical protein